MRHRHSGFAFALSLALGALAGALAPDAALAHPGLDLQIAALTERLGNEPRNAELLLRRGELHRVHRDWTAAMADYDRAAAADPGLAAVDLARGRAYLEAGFPTQAIAALDRFLAARPDHAEARVHRARALVALASRAPRPSPAEALYLEAAGEYTRALPLLPRPEPEHFIERARALSAAGDAHLEDALRGLDEGIRGLGPIVTLQLEAVDLELRLGRHDAALARVDALAAPSERKETWLARRGEILESAGRAAEAREAYAHALVAIDALPVHCRHAPATRVLEDRLRAVLKRPTDPRIVPMERAAPRGDDANAGDQPRIRAPQPASAQGYGGSAEARMGEGGAWRPSGGAGPPSRPKIQGAADTRASAEAANTVTGGHEQSPPARPAGTEGGSK